MYTMQRALQLRQTPPQLRLCPSCLLFGNCGLSSNRPQICSQGLQLLSLSRHNQAPPHPSAKSRTDSPSANFPKKFAETDGHAPTCLSGPRTDAARDCVSARGHGRPNAPAFPGADANRPNPRTSQNADADGRGTGMQFVDGQPRISGLDGMVVWHKLCRTTVP